jgi:hypothetical protein
MGLIIIIIGLFKKLIAANAELQVNRLHKLSRITISLKICRVTYFKCYRRHQYLQVIKFKNLSVFMELEHLDSLKCRKSCSWFITTLL